LKSPSLKTGRLLVGLAVVLGFLCKALCAEPSFTIGPYLQSVTETSIVVCWESDVPGDGTVEYWVEGSQTSSFVKVENAQRHEVTLTDLQPGTAYCYRVRIPKEGQGTFFTAGFRTPPTGGEDVAFTFAAYGDSRESGENDRDHKAVVDAIRAFDPAFVIHLGDIVRYGDSLFRWGIFWRNVSPARGEDSVAGNAPFYPVLGNHEYMSTEGYKDEAIRKYQDYFVLPANGLESEHPEWTDRFYSFRYGPAFLIILDVNNDSDPDYDVNSSLIAGPPDIHPGSPQYEWLINQLKTAKAQKSTFTFVCFHHSPYSTGFYGQGAAMKLRFLDPVFREYGVDAVFTSHDHVYERCETYVEDYRIRYFVEGAGGAPLYPRTEGWDEPGSWMWDELNQTFYTKAFDNTSHSFIKIDIVPLGNGTWQATFSAIRPNGEVFDVVRIRRPWGYMEFDEALTFWFEAIPGETYQVDYSNDLPRSEMEWHAVGPPIVADGPFVRIIDNGAETGVAPSDESVTHRFYRVRQLR